MESVLADEATDMGGEFSEDEWRVLCSLFGDIEPDSADGLMDTPDSEVLGETPIAIAD